MKKLLLLIITILTILPLLSIAQNTQSVVTLKNGTELTGVIKSIDPMDALTIVIGGVETTIKMENVAKISEYKEDVPSVATTNDVPKLNPDDKLIVTDMGTYPESFELKIGDAKIKMILVRGGDMNMGFDGRHSQAMNSEPVHKVKVTTFYMSETFVTSEIANQFVKSKCKKVYYIADNWKKANEIVQMIAQKSGMAYRLPTEAEWEYAACSPVQNRLFNVCNSFEYCSDWYDKYFAHEFQVDPIGPSKSFYHVVRAYERNRGKFDRSDYSSNQRDNPFRIVIKAKDIK